MNYKRIITGAFLFGSIIAFSAFIKIDDDPISKIAAQLEKWFTDHPQEKVYLQLDKPYYAIGDDIWFKAYITSGPNHELSGISGVLNVELINDKDSIKQSIKLPVVSGLTWGDFSLADSLKEGNYRIRAYTNWMRNASDEYFFDKTISIVNSIKNNVFTKADYAYSTQKGQQKVSSVINFVDLNGVPYVNNQVSYEVQLNFKTISKGKSQTDDKGNLNVSFTNTDPDLLKSGRIITNLKLSDKTTVTKSVLIKATSDKVDMQFFPEGGNLVVGNYSKIAFKAVAADGLGTDVKGVIIDDQNSEVTTFSSSHLGMGSFYFKPDNGKTYKAKLTYADGSVNTVDLPKAVNTGYSLSVINSDADNIKVKIVPGPVVTLAAGETPVISLIAQEGGVIYYAAKSKPGANFFSATIPKKKFPSGIVQFTIFSTTGEPLNERLAFIQNHDQLKLDVTSEKQSYAPRQKVKIDLSAGNENGKPMLGSFSVAVTDETKVPVNESNENTIISNLLLTSDLRGYIEKPNYYFSAANEKTEADLDLLMLTQGYHRFEWKQVESNTSPAVTFKPEKTLEVSGRIKTLGGKPIPKGKVTLFTNMGGIFLLDTVSDNEGFFTFKNLVFKDSIKFMLQGRTAKDRKFLQIDVDNAGPPKVAKNKNAADMEVNISNALSPFLQNSKRMYTEQLKYGINNGAIQLKEVVITEKKQLVLKDSQNLNGPGNADQIIGSADFEKWACPVLTDCLQGRLTGVIFRNGTPYSTRSLNRAMEIIVDGIPVDADFLNDLVASQIESVEVLRSIGYTSIYGGRGGGGVLIITTRKGGPDNNIQRYAPGVITYSPKGFHKTREFYAPQYDNPKTNTQVPDLRSTVFWKPNIVTGKDGKTSFEFFNADTRGTYRVVVEGIDEDGNIGRQVYHYKVE
jgi:hypothetical protein